MKFKFTIAFICQGTQYFHDWEKPETKLAALLSGEKKKGLSGGPCDNEKTQLRIRRL